MRRQINAEELQILYNAIGESIWSLLNAEDALNNYITLKHDIKIRGSVSLEQGEAILAEHRKNPLGASLKISRESQVLSKNLQQRFEKFNKERIWLVHHSFYQHHEDLYVDETRYALIRRIRAFSEEAWTLHKLVCKELEDFVVAQGVSREWIMQEAERKIKNLKGEEI